MSRGFKDVFGDLHPTRRQEMKGKDLPVSRGSRGNENRFVRCRKCGQINNLENRVLGDGWSGNITYQPISGVSSNQKEPIVGSGCVFCGSSNGWDETREPTIIDHKQSTDVYYQEALWEYGLNRWVGK